MKFNKLTNKIKLSSALIATTTIVGGAFLSVPLLLSTNNKIISNNSNYKNLIDQDNKSTGSSDFSSQPAEIQDFFSIHDKTEIYTDNDSRSLFAVVTKDDGFDVLYAWGDNYNGQLGLGVTDTNKCPFPTLVLGLPSNSKITHVALSLQATTVVVNYNQIWVTGSNGYGEHGERVGNLQEFTKITTWEDDKPKIESIHAGARHRVVVTTDSVWVWGDNKNGQLGTGGANTEWIPVDLTPILKGVIPNWADGEFYASADITALLVNGQLHMWGNGNYGMLGNGNVSGDNVETPPKEPVALENIVKFSMGATHSLALLGNGDLYSWGWNYDGQLGIGNIKDSRIPIKVTTMLNSVPISGVTDVFTCYYTSFIQIDNKIYSCGDTDSGILAQGPTSANRAIFSPVILDSSAVINSIYTTTWSLIVNLNTGLHMAGSNVYGEFANGIMNSDDNHTLTQVTPFGTPIKLTTKLDNTNYTADGVVADLKNQTTAANIRSSLAKYVDGIDSIPPESTLSYAVLPTASPDNAKVTITLKTNRSFGDNDAKIGGDFDFPITITNFWFEESSIIIKNKPIGVHTANIQAKLNPNIGSFLSGLWQQIVDMTKFPGGTTFTSISDDNVIAGTGADGTYTGNIVASDHYTTTGPTGTPKSFHFEITGITKTPPSDFTQKAIVATLNKDNVKTELAPGLIEKAEYLQMFVDETTFPTDTKFTIDAIPVINYDNRTLTCVLAVDKYYENGLLQTRKTKTYTFNNFKTIEKSELAPTAELKNDDFNSANINELLIKNNTINKDILGQITSISSFPIDTIFTIVSLNGVDGLDIANRTFSGTLHADKIYSNWIEAGGKDFGFEFTNITIVGDSKIVIREEIPSEYNIDNIESKLKSGTEIDKALERLIDTSWFPPNTTFKYGETIKTDPATGEFIFNVIPSHHYSNGKSGPNNADTPYSITIKFALPVPANNSNLGLIIGLSVGGVALLGIIAAIVWWKIKTKNSQNIFSTN